MSTLHQPFSILVEQPTPDELHTLLSLFPEDDEVQDAIKTIVLNRCRQAQETASDRSFEISFTNWTGRFILLIVHIILAFALCLSWKEFASAHRLRTKAAGESSPVQPVQEVSISAEGLALKTSLQGTFLMLVALAFYFLYLKYVFPVVAVETTASSPF